MFFIGIMLFFIFFISGSVMVAQGNWFPAIFLIVASLLIVALLVYFSRKLKRKKEIARELREFVCCTGDAVCCLFDIFDLCV